MTHQPEKKGFDLFNKHKRPRRGNARLKPGLLRTVQSVNLLHLGSALFQTVSGFFLFSLVTGHTLPAWTVLLSVILGCILIATGIAMLCSTFRNRRTVNNMVKETIRRAIRDQN